MRVPLHSGSRVPLVTLPDDAVLLGAPPPLDALADIGAAVDRGLPLPARRPAARESLAPRGGRATVVVQPPAVPLPTAQDDARRDALAAVLGELSRAGVARESVTVLVAGGLARRPGRRELESLLRPDQATGLPRRDRRPRLRGGRSAARRRRRPPDARPPRTRRDRSDRDGRAPARACSTAARRRWSTRACPARCAPRARCPCSRRTGAAALQIGAALEEELGRAVPVIGLSLVLDRPRTTGLYRGYPWRPEAIEAVGRSPFRRLLNASPAVLRRRVARRRAPRARRRRGAGRAALGRPRGGARARHRRAERRRRAAVRHDRRAAAVGRAAPAARAPEPDHGRRARARSRAAPLAQPAAARPRAAPSSCSTRSRASWATARRRRTSPSSRRSATAPPRRGSAAWRPRPHATGARSRPIAAAAPRIRGCRSPTGRPAARCSSARAASSSRAAATRARRGRSASSRRTTRPTALAMAEGLAGPEGRTGVILGPPYPALIVSGAS